MVFLNKNPVSPPTRIADAKSVRQHPLSGACRHHFVVWL